MKVFKGCRVELDYPDEGGDPNYVDEGKQSYANGDAQDLSLEARWVGGDEADQHEKDEYAGALVINVERHPTDGNKVIVDDFRTASEGGCHPGRARGNARLQ